MTPVKALYLGKDFKGDPPLYMKIAAGLTTGALAISVASPTDLVKVRSGLAAVPTKQQRLQLPLMNILACRFACRRRASWQRVFPKSIQTHSRPTAS